MKRRKKKEEERKEKKKGRTYLADSNFKDGDGEGGSKKEQAS